MPNDIPELKRAVHNAIFAELTLPQTTFTYHAWVNWVCDRIEECTSGADDWDWERAHARYLIAYPAIGDSWDWYFGRPSYNWCGLPDRFPHA